MTDKRQKVLNRVQALYMKAANSGFGPEAEAFTAKADELMIKFQIEEAELAMAGSVVDPYQFEIRKFPIGEVEGFKTQLESLFLTCANHLGLRLGMYDVDSLSLVGARTDLDFFGIMYTNLMGHMARCINPKPDPQLSEEENLYNLKFAGYSWKQCHERLYPDVPWERRHGVRYTSVVKKFAEQFDLPRNMTSGTGGQRAYRTQFANAYVRSVSNRLQELRNIRENHSPGNALALVGKEDRLEDFFYDLFPERRPHPADCDCDSCHYCMDTKCQRRRCVNARRPVRYIRGPVGPAYNPIAAMAGEKAAASADLGSARVGQRKQLRE